MAVPFEGGSNYRNKLAQRQAAKKRRQQAGLRNTAANAGPPSSSKTFSTPAPRDTKPSTNRFALKGITGKDGIPDKIFEEAVRLGTSSVKDMGVSGSQILNEAANVGILSTIFGKDYLARGAGNIIGMADKRAGEQFEDMATGEVTPMDIVNVSDVFAPGLAKAAKISIKGIKNAPAAYRGMLAESQKLGIVPKFFEDDYIKDVFDIKHPLEDKELIQSFETRTPITELIGDEAKVLGQVDELVNKTKEQAEKQGIKIGDISPWLRIYSHALSPKDRNALYRLFEPTEVGMDFRVSTKSRPNIDEIKQAMYRTMAGGAKRQEAYGQQPDMPYSSWQDIPDDQASDIIDKMVGNWKVFDAEGRLISGESVQLDHIIDLILGGKNTELQPMSARANARKGANAKEQAKRNK